MTGSRKDVTTRPRIPFFSYLSDFYSYSILVHDLVRFFFLPFSSPEKERDPSWRLAPRLQEKLKSISISPASQRSRLQIKRAYLAVQAILSQMGRATFFFFLFLFSYFVFCINDTIHRGHA